MIVIFIRTVGLLLVIYITPIYITNVYRRKISSFYSVQRLNLVKKYTNFFALEEDRMTSVDYNFSFLFGRPHGAGPPPPSTCVHLNLTSSPCRVDVINGWPLNTRNVHLHILH